MLGDQLLIPFIETLPVIAKHFLSAGSRSCDLLCKLLLKMRSASAKGNEIQPSPWVKFLIWPNESERQALSKVLHQLLNAENGMDGWEGSARLRLCAIISLYFFFDKEECHASVCKAMFHYYPLLLTSKSGSEEGAVDQPAFLHDSQTYFDRLFMSSSSPSTFQSFCSLFNSSHFPNLPEAFLSCIALHVDSASRTTMANRNLFDRSPVSRPWTMNASVGLDDLFRYFLIHQEGSDSNLANREEERYRTLSRLINIVIDSSACFSKTDCGTPDPCWWKLFYSWLDVMEQQLAKISTAQCDPIPAVHGEEPEEGKNSTTDDVGNHSFRITENRPIGADHLRELINRVKGALDEYPLPLPSSSGSSSNSRSINSDSSDVEIARLQSPRSPLPRASWMRIG
jgi:hypothetical protein